MLSFETFSYHFLITLSSRLNKLTLRHSKGINWDSLSKSNVFKLHTFIFELIMSKVTLPKSTYYSSALFEQVQHFDVTKDLSSNMQHDCPWMQINTLYLNHQCLVCIYFEFLLNIGQCIQ